MSTYVNHASNSHINNGQNQIQQDWENREFNESMISNIKRVTDFLNSFEQSCRGKLALLDEKLTILERQVEYFEAKLTQNEFTEN